MATAELGGGDIPATAQMDGGYYATDLDMGHWGAPSETYQRENRTRYSEKRKEQEKKRLQ